MTLWVFGDSYAKHYENLDNQWTALVSKSLNTDMRTFGLVGSSAEYTYNCFNKVRQDIKKNDIVVLALTTHSRRWFFKDYPNHTAQPAPGTDYKEPKSVYNPTGISNVDVALSLYEDHLNNHDVFNTYLENFLYNLDYHTKKLNLHTIILINFYDTEYFLKDKRNQFSSLRFSNGMMLDISLNEFTKDFFLEYNTSIPDIRINHMIKSNHTILANKILDNIQNNKEIDLTTGFLKHIFNKQNFNDPNFIKEELFNGILR